MRITPKQYAQTLYTLTEGKPKPEIEKSVFYFANYLSKNRKLKLLDKIIEQFENIFNQKNGIAEAETVTREKMDESEMKRTEEYIKEKFKAKEVVLKNKIDKSVKGGMILKVGDEVIDGSIRGRLEELKKVLVR